MKLLLDTHTFLWFIGGSPKLTRYICQLIEEPANERLLSVASLWEMSIKVSLDKLKLSTSFVDLVAEQVYGNAISLLDIAPEHLDVLRTLPFHHRDPFDRLIIAQGLSESLPILSRDNAFDDYGVRRLWRDEL